MPYDQLTWSHSHLISDKQALPKWHIVTHGHAHTQACSHTSTHTQSLSATLWLFNMPEIFTKILTILRKIYLIPPWPEWPWKRVLAKFQKKQPASPDCYSYSLMPPLSPFFLARDKKQIMILRTRLKLREEFRWDPHNWKAITKSQLKFYLQRQPTR